MPVCITVGARDGGVEQRKNDGGVKKSDMTGGDRWALLDSSC